MKHPPKLLGQVTTLNEGSSPIGMHYLDQECSIDGCDKNLVRVIEVNPLDIGIESTSSICLDRCLNCNIYASDVSHQYNSKGETVWSSDVIGECANAIWDYDMEGSFAAVKWTPFDESVKRNCGPILAGGEAEWEQGECDVKCAKCAKEMSFILQIPSSALDNSRDENGLSIKHDEKRRWEGTEIEDFSLTFDGNYATCFLFKCFDCNVCTSITQA